MFYCERTEDEKFVVSYEAVREKKKDTVPTSISNSYEQWKNEVNKCVCTPASKYTDGVILNRYIHQLN